MNLNPVVLSIPLYFVLIGIELVVDRIQKRKLYRLNDAVTNISCGITQQLTGIFLKVLSVGVYQLVFENFALFDLNQSWWYWILLFIGVDFFYYWAHRMSHEVNLFWGGHVVHHQSEEYNLSVALRQSTFQVVWTFVFYMPLALLGFRALDFVMVMGLNLIYQFWIHTETIGKMGWFEYIFNTPSHHRVHHGRNPKYIDKNHAGTFIIWDKMFGTFQKEEERPTYGITTPINSWNPVWVNLDHYIQMWKTAKTIPSLANKLRYAINKPGWLPESMGGYQPAPEIDKAKYQKFDTTSPISLNFYVLVQYALALAVTAFFLFNQAQFSLGIKALMALGIVITIMNCGLLFENKNWVKYTEYMRITAISVVCIYLSFISQWNLYFFIGGIAYSLVSSLWLLSLGNLKK